MIGTFPSWFEYVTRHLPDFDMYDAAVAQDNPILLSDLLHGNSNKFNYP